MKKITKRLSIRREVLLNLDLRDLREAAGGSITKPIGSCTNCTGPNTVTACTTRGTSCETAPPTDGC